ncbi:variable surface protein [Plasmodium gonderi]|uniref:Variable surface protein n=1 Tax=Plasmodium gonderi TaxID=77519 RepID=A0A1Y1JMY3_PLAGO|nr:variable surface protein [Plasmodium gonderi]GAW83946.1 variable surface protein [Plasmodium gonderi]
MDSTINPNQDFNFEEIFPKCRNNFNSFNKYNTWEYINNYSKLCNDFGQSINLRYGEVAFQDSCIILGAYLESIKDKKNRDSEFNIRPYCNYFYYKLKALVKLYEAECDTANDCYTKWMQKRQGVIRITVPTVCNNIDVQKLNNSIFDTMKYLDKLFENLEELKRYINRKDFIQASQVATSCKEKYENLVVISKSMNNQSFINLLNEYNEDYVQFINKIKEQEGIQKMAQVATTTNEAGVVLLTFSIIIIMFILFKYTRYGIYLQRKPGKLRRMMRKKYKEYLNLMNSIEKTRNDSIYRKHKISYGTHDYT